MNESQLLFSAHSISQSFWAIIDGQIVGEISTFRRIAGAAKPPDRENSIFIEPVLSNRCKHARRRNLRSLFSVGCEVKTTFSISRRAHTQLPKLIIKSVELVKRSSSEIAANRSFRPFVRYHPGDAATAG